MIVEMAGMPAEHVKETLTKHVNVLTKFKDINVYNIAVSEPKQLENSEGIFTCFAEVEFDTENFGRLSDTVFDFMPSSIEILEPSKITFNLQEAASILNNISGRMHRYDEVARYAQVKMNEMAKQIQENQQGKNEEIRTENPKKKSKKN
jgi:hypothetical protein